MTLCQKEWLEAWRDKKVIWLPAVLAILAISEPVTTYFMPEILDMAGNLPEGAIIEIPVPTGEEVLAGTLSQFGLIGTAVFVLSAMGSISNERGSGVLSLVMSRPVSSFEYIASKWTVHALIFLFSFAFSYGLAYYYTNLLFNSISFKGFVLSFGVYSLWILLVLSITLLAGTVLRKNGGIAGISILAAAGLTVISSLFPSYTEWSPANAQEQAGNILMAGSGSDGWGFMVAVSVVSILGLVLLSVLAFRRFASYRI